MIKSIIASMGKNRVIGQNNQLMWRLPAELAYFKETTMGHHMIVGRKTFESFPKVLPGRTTIVVSRDPNYKVPKDCFLTTDVTQAFELAQNRNETEVFVTGGAQIYSQTIDQVDRIYLTTVDFNQEGDAYFPIFDLTKWQMIKEIKKEQDEKNAYSWIAQVFEKK